MNIYSTFAIIMLACSSLLTSAHAARWPVFSAPDKNYLLAFGFIETVSCPDGMGKIRPNINITLSNSPLCRTFCPGYWQWQRYDASNSNCYKLNMELELKEYQIHNIKHSNGLPNYSIVTAFYGNKDSGHHSFSLTFKTLPGDYWHCFVENNKLQTISCANDI